jgi:WD40 repeat protein
LNKKCLYIIVLLTILSLPGSSQQTRETFGKNRLQYREFNWRYYSTQNFDVYFYGKSDKTALLAIDYLENEFNRVTEVVGYSPYFKAKVFLYNSINDLQQSNIGVGGQSHRVGGQTEFIKSYVEVANPGSVRGFKENLSIELSKLILNDMMFGGSLTDMWQNTYLMNLPSWFVDGASEYMARGWSLDMDDRMRDLIISGKVKKLNRLTGEQSIFAGQSMWNFIVEKYGKSNLNQILNLVRVTRNEEKSISFTLGISFRQVVLEWQQYYSNMVNEVTKSYVVPNKENIVFRSDDNQKISAVALSPDGTKLAYAINEEGKFAVLIKDLQTNRVIKAMKGGHKMVNQEMDDKVPLLNWSDDQTLGIVAYSKGQIVLWLYDVTTKSRMASPLFNFDRVNSFDFSGNGRLAILSATRNGKTDLFLLSVRRNKLRRLTDDLYDDITPRFIPNTNTIIFSSNRVNDSLKSGQTSYTKMSQNFNIFVFNLDTTRNVLARLTNTISRDYNPIAKDDRTFYYLSDQKGIVNLFRYDLDDSLYMQITNFTNNVRKVDINFATSAVAYTMVNRLDETIYYKSGVNYSGNIFTPLTPRQLIMQAKFITSRRLLRASQERSKGINIKIRTPVVKEDTSRLDSLVVKEIMADTVAGADTATVIQSINKDKEDLTTIIDTDDYVFDKEVTKKAQETGSFLSNYRRVAKEEKPRGPLPYQTRFNANSMVTSWVIDQFRGFGVLLETEMNDMLENHKFYGGIMTTLDLKSGDVFAEYRYLPYLVDYNLRYDRSVWYVNENESLRQRYSKNRFEVGASLPFSPRTRLALKPFFMFTRYQDLNFINLLPNSQKAEANTTSYLGISSELTYDNSVVRGQNVIVGTRMKLEFSHYEALNDRSRSFDNVSLDLRHYQKIYKNFVIAGRLFYGKFFGKYQHSYMIGGMDNWLFKSDPENLRPWMPEVSKENNNIYFMEYVTSLRGYEYNALNGTDALLINLELRLPVLSLLYNGPVRSSFAKNLQFVGFFDIGSSWTGASPFSEENSISTIVVRDQIFEAEIQTFKNPWLSGYGIGMRSVVLGYFMKFDLAWPLEDFEVGDAKFYFTLGHDF